MNLKSFSGVNDSITGICSSVHGWPVSCNNKNLVHL